MTAYACLVLLIGWTTVEGQSPGRPSLSAPESDELTISLVTVGPGPAVWEAFGHSALLVDGVEGGAATLYNWGLFDFSEPGFLRRFLRGELRYWAGAQEFDAASAAYSAQGRSVVVQRMHLSQQEKRQLLRLLQLSLAPENRFYLYDYYSNNCTTKVRDLVDASLSGVLAASGSSTAKATYRELTLEYLGGHWWAALGIDVLLGARADQPLTRWGEMFLPLELQRALDALGILGHAEGGAGVESEAALTWPSHARHEGGRSWYLSMLFGLAGGALVFRLGHAARRSKLSLRLFQTIGASWAILASAAGGVILLLWFASDHVFASSNENVLLLNPGWLVVAGVLLRPSLGTRWFRVCVWLAKGLFALVLLSVAIQLLPFNHQPNGHLLSFIVPVHLALLWHVSARVPRDEDAAHRSIA